METGEILIYQNSEGSTVVRKFRTTASDGKNYETSFYNLDVIISVGYRVKSQQGTQLHIWEAQQCYNEFKFVA